MSRGTGSRRKAAIALVAMGSERAAAVLRSLGEEEARLLAAEVAELGSVSPDEVRAAVRELSDKVHGDVERLPAPGRRFAKDLLLKAYGPEKGGAAGAALDVARPFGWLAAADPDAAAQALGAEPAGAVALALAHCEPRAAARLLTRLPEAVQQAVALRIAGLGSVHPDTVTEVEQSLRARVESVVVPDVRRIAGPEVLAEMLSRAGKDRERAVLQAVALTDPQLAEATKAHLFTFADVLRLEARSMQALLKAVETRDLAVALSTAEEGERDAVLSNLSERARDTLLEEIDLLRGVKASDVTDARRAVVATARRLEEEGALVLSRAGDDEEEAA